MNEELAVFKLRSVDTPVTSPVVSTEDYSFEDIAQYLSSDDPISSIRTIYNRLNEISKTGHYRKTLVDKEGRSLRDSAGNILSGEEQTDFIIPGDDESELIKEFAAALSDPKSHTVKDLRRIRNISNIIKALSQNENEETLRRLLELREKNDDKLNSEFQQFIQEKVIDTDEGYDAPEDSDPGLEIDFGEIKATKREDTSNGGNRHYLFLDNIDDSGLNLCIVEDKSFNGQIGIIIKDKDGEDAKVLNNDQWNALRHYFLSSKTRPDNWKELNKIKVTHQVIKHPIEHDDDGWCKKEEITEDLGDALAKEFCLLPSEEQNQQLNENIDTTERDTSQEPDNESAKEREQNINADAQKIIDDTYKFIESLEENKEKYIEPTKEDQSDSYYSLNAGIAALEGKFVEKYGPLNQGDSTHPVSNVLFDWAGNVTISFWPNQGARDKDNKIHTKDWSQEGSTKIWSVKIYRGKNGNPVKAGLFIPNPKNFDAKDAGAVLASFKKMGATTFTMPPASVYGSQVFDAFLEAAVKSGLPPKISEMDIQISDLKKLHEFIDGDKSKLQPTSAQRIQFLLKYSAELKKKMETMKPSDKSTASTWLIGYQKRIRFEAFNASTLLVLKGFVDSDVGEIVPKEIIKDGDCVNELHGIAAKIGLGKILAAVDKGRVLNIVVDNNGNPVMENGKPKLKEPKYKPLDPRTSDTRYMTAVLKAYVALEYENVEKAAIAQVNEEAKYRVKDQSDKSSDDRIYKTAMRALKDRYDSKYNKLIDDICDGGGSFLQAKDLKVDIAKGLTFSRTVVNTIPQNQQTKQHNVNLNSGRNP